ncbi:unnamed protein product [Brassica oleracea var. botrytis]|uniref:Uncharacterized protein n=2 Tax=Brassica TaxID=3705 RepID=A0A3P6B2U1_BRAOL|nr:unnamed protein product [Brassica napus]VDC94653.1 unnamed protein product [Brassica oleracea]
MLQQNGGIKQLIKGHQTTNKRNKNIRENVHVSLENRHPFFSSSFSSFFVEVSRTPPSRVLLLTPSRTCLDAAASLPPLWASNDSVLHLLLCERLCISSFDSLYYATPDLFFFSICRRQWWLSLLDLLCSKRIPAQHCRLFSIDIGIPPASSLLRGYTKLEPLTIAEMSSSSLPSHRISTSYAPVGALGSRWTKAGVTSLSPCVQRSFSGLYHPSLVSCVACNNTNVVGVLSIADETAEGLFVGFDGVILNCISYVHMNLVIYWLERELTQKKNRLEGEPSVKLHREKLLE